MPTVTKTFTVNDTSGIGGLSAFVTVSQGGVQLYSENFTGDIIEVSAGNIGEDSSTGGSFTFDVSLSYTFDGKNCSGSFTDTEDFYDGEPPAETVTTLGFDPNAEQPFYFLSGDGNTNVIVTLTDRNLNITNVPDGVDTLDIEVEILLNPYIVNDINNGTYVIPYNYSYSFKDVSILRTDVTDFFFGVTYPFTVSRNGASYDPIPFSASVETRALEFAGGSVVTATTALTIIVTVTDGNFQLTGPGSNTFVLQSSKDVATLD